MVSLDDITTIPASANEAIAEAKLDALVSQLTTVGVYLNEVTETVAIPGSFGDELRLRKGPVSSVGTVLCNGLEVDPSSFDVYPWGLKMLGGASVGSFSTASYWKPNWGGPGARLTVTYTAGYADQDVPEWVLAVLGDALLLAERSSGIGVRQESVGPFSTTYSGRAGTTSLGRRELRAAKKALLKI